MERVLKVCTLRKTLSALTPANCRTAVTSGLNLHDVEYSKAIPANKIPGAMSFPIIGNIWTFMPFIGKYDLRRFNLSSLKMYEDYGPIVKVNLTTFNKFIWIYDPKDIQKLLQHEGKNPDRPWLASMKKVAENLKEELPHEGLLNTNGQEWYDLRTLVQPHMMKPKTVITFLPAMDSVAKEFVERIQYLRKDDKEVDDLNIELNKWALESVGVVALDTHLGCLRKDADKDSEGLKLIKSAQDVFEQSYQLEFASIPFWRFFPTRRFKEFQNNIKFFNTVALKYLKQAEERLALKKLDEDADLTLLENLLLQKTPPKMISVMIRDMFLAGIDTTSNTLGFFMYFMAKNPEIQEKLHQEIISLLPTTDTPITQDTLNNIRYTKACLKESMRLLPVAGGTVRTVKEDIVLSGYQVPKDSRILIAMLATGLLDINFKNPKEFIPERWLKNRQDEEKTNPFAFLPFGFGARSCIGRRIAEQELYTAIIRLIQRYRVEYHHEDIGLYSRLVNVPDKPLRFQFHDRDLK